MMTKCMLTGEHILKRKIHLNHEFATFDLGAAVSWYTGRVPRSSSTEEEKICGIEEI
jgi:hypothetical protein